MVAMQLHQCQMLRCVSNPCSRYAIMHSVFFYSHLQLSRLEMRCLFNNHLLRYFTSIYLRFTDAVIKTFTIYNT